jgi:hypothetical protein
MHYYRKAAAIFIVIFTLMFPFYLEVESEVAVVEINTLIVESEYLSSAAIENTNQEIVKTEIMEIVKKSAEEFALKNNYSSVVTKHLIYKGGEDISRELAKKIDAEN